MILAAMIAVIVGLLTTAILTARTNPGSLFIRHPMIGVALLCWCVIAAAWWGGG